MSVLIVDDSKSMRGILRRALQFAGVAAEEMFEAADGLEAWNLLPEVEPDLVITDLHMPNMMGDELLDHMREGGLLEHTQVVMVSSAVGAKHSLDLVRRGASKVIRKPFKPHTLSEKLAEFITVPEPEEPQAELLNIVAAGQSPVGQSQYPQYGSSDAEVEAQRLALEQSTRALCCDALVRVLEDVVNLPAERSAPDLVDGLPPTPPADRLLFGAVVQLNSPDAELGIFCTREVSALIAEGLTGEEPGGDDSLLADAIKELLNITTGDLINSLASGEGGVTPDSFQIPEQVLVLPAQLPTEDTEAISLVEEDGHVFLRFMMSEGETE